MILPSCDAVIHGLTAFVALSILVSGLDDCFVDCWYYGSEVYRRIKPRKYPIVREAQLRELSEQPIAIMIPAWHEHAVIGRMLANTIRTVEYKNYDVFVGTYPNDEETMLAVAKIEESESRVHRVVCPHDGPTNKADCLNWIIEGIRHFDKTTRRGVRIFMLHDSEDWIHPLSFKLMNYFVGRYPMVQLPVVPFETPLREVTAGSYLDEFAESHLKDMVVRERLSGMVPSAGVGTGFSRDAVDRLAQRFNNQVFNVATFTEDYDLAFRLKELGEASILLQFFIERTKTVRSRWSRRERIQSIKELVGTREYFPTHFRDAIRQKARWTLGIVFHGWQQRGWEGDWALRYMVWRDRKTLITQSVNMLGYALLIESAVSAHWGHQSFRSNITTASWVWKVILADTVLLANRCLQRMAATWRIAGPAQAALAVPRIVWGNVINFCAVAKSTHMFLKSRWTGKKLVWAKTAHAFPSEEQLLGFKRKLGDLLLERRLLTLSKLEQALKRQKESGALLGDTLVDLGLVPERVIIEVLGAQLKIETCVVDCERVTRESFDLVPESAAREHLMIVVDTRATPVLIAAADVHDARMRRWLDANLHVSYRLVLAGRRNIVAAIDRFAQMQRAFGANLWPESPGTGKSRHLH